MFEQIQQKVLKILQCNPSTHLPAPAKLNHLIAHCVKFTAQQKHKHTQSPIGTFVLLKTSGIKRSFVTLVHLFQQYLSECSPQ